MALFVKDEVPFPIFSRRLIRMYVFRLRERIGMFLYGCGSLVHIQ